MASAPDDVRAEIPLLIADLYEVAGAMRRHGDRLASTAGQTQARWQLLNVISDGDWTASHVARRLGISRQAVQRVVDALVADGLAVLEVNPNHERSSLIRPTEHGRRALAEIGAHAGAFHAELAEAIVLDDLRAARRVLRALVEFGGA